MKKQSAAKQDSVKKKQGPKQKKPAKKKPAVKKKTSKVLVYGVVPGDLLYIMPLEVAQRNARLKHVMCDSTWREAKSLLKPDEYKELIEEFTAFEPDEEIHPDDPVPDFMEIFCGDTPLIKYPEQHLSKWLPKSIVDKYVEEGISMVDGLLEYIDPKHTENIIADLEKLGYTCIKNEPLINFCTNQYCPVDPDPEEYLLEKKNNKRRKK